MGKVQSIYLHQLAKDKSSDGKKTFAKTISDTFLKHYPSLTKRERGLMYDILQQSIHQAEMEIRVRVSEKLATSEGVPRNLAKILANDEIEVAFPILSTSDALLDDDLIEIIHKRSVEHQLAVTKRPAVNEAVSDALVEKGNEDVIASLLLNPNSRISSTTVEYLVEESKRLTKLQKPILRREDLDPALGERMFGWVSSSLRQYIMDNYELDPDYVNKVIEDSVLEEMEAKSKSDSRAHGDRLTEEIARDGPLDPDIMVRVLQDGDVRLFISMFKKYTGVSDNLILQMLNDRDATGLAIACKAAKLGKPVFSSLFACGYKARQRGSKLRRQDIGKILGRFDKMSEEAAEKVVGSWQQNAGYRSAIRELEI